MTALTDYFAPHLHELRRRLLTVVATVAGLAGVAYLFAEPLVKLLAAPLARIDPALGKLVYTSLPEAFISYIKIALLVGLLGAFPVLVYQIWMFVAPGLHPHEKATGRRVAGWGMFLFGGGALFAYFVVMPEMLRFLRFFAPAGAVPHIKIGGYLTFVVRSVLAFGLAFEMPFLMVMASKSGLVARDYFKRQRKYFYLGILLIAFLLAAGDPVATILLTLPLCGLYEAGILIGRLFGRPAATSESEMESESE